MKFATVKTILTAAQENKQYIEINLKSRLGVHCDFTESDDHKPNIIGYNSDTEVISVLKDTVDVYIDCEAIEYIEVYK